MSEVRPIVNVTAIQRRFSFLTFYLVILTNCNVKSQYVFVYVSTKNLLNSDACHFCDVVCLLLLFLRRIAGVSGVTDDQYSTWLVIACCVVSAMFSHGDDRSPRSYLSGAELLLQWRHLLYNGDSRPTILRVSPLFLYSGWTFICVYSDESIYFEHFEKANGKVANTGFKWPIKWCVCVRAHACVITSLLCKVTSLYRPKPIHCNYHVGHYSGFSPISPSILNRFTPNLQA